MLTKNYKINKRWISADRVTIVDFQLAFSHDDLPGVESVHTGIIPVSVFDLPATSTDDEIVVAIDALVIQDVHLEQFHWDQLQFLFMQKVSSVVGGEITGTDVDWERDRRANSGFTYNGVRYQTRPEDRENMAGASTAALGAMMAGAQPGDLRWHGGDSDFHWIAEDNSLHAMDAQSMFAFGQAAMQHKQAMIFTARVLKDMSPIPADYTNDIYWP